MELMDMNLGSEITKLVEMEKVFNTSFERIEPVNTTFYKNVDEDLPRGATVTHDFDKNHRIDNDIARMIYGASNSEIDLNNYVSKSLSSVIHHHFNYHRKNVESLLGIKVKQIDDMPNLTSDFIASYYNENLDVHVFIDVENEKVYMYDDANYLFTNDSKHESYNVREYTYDDRNALLRNLLRLNFNEKLVNDNQSRALRDLWLYQIQESDIEMNYDSVYSDMSDDLKHIVAQLEDDILSFDNRKHVKYKDVFVFFEELRNEQLTEKSRNAQEWVGYNDLDIALSSFSTHDNFDKVKNLKKASFREIESIVQTFEKDKHFKRNSKVLNVYELNQKQDVTFGNDHNNTIFTGVHGTPNSSVMSILLNGLKDRASSDKSGLSYKSTGLGLGDGVYFAQMHQASKSANYTRSANHEGSRFLIIADVHYDSKTKITVGGYSSNNSNKNHSLVYAEAVGISHGYDEILTPYPENINMRYLVEIGKR